MPLPSDVKNQRVRDRGNSLGEAGADWSYGSTAKPEADEHRAPDKSKGELTEGRQDPTGEERGADVRGEPSMIQRNEDFPEAATQVPRAFPDLDPPKKKTGEF